MGGGKNKKQTIGYKFYAGANLVLARYISKILQIKIGDKLAVEGSFSGGDIQINNELLFGTKAEGGVSGVFRFRKGDSLQDVDPYLASLLGSDISADIGVSSLTLVNPYLGNTPYMKDISIRGERVFELEDGVEQWYSEKAGIQNNEQILQGDSSWAYFYENNYSGSYPPNPASVTPPTSGFISSLPAPFGYLIGGIPGLPLPVNSLWPQGTRLWLKQTFSADAGKELKIHFWVENAGYVYVDGQYVGGVNVTNSQTVGIHEAFFNYTPSASGEHIIHVLALDEANTPPSTSQTYVYLSVSLSSVTWDINPVHIIRESLMNTEWGYGYSETDIDDANFKSVADTLYAESFGLSYFWDDDTTLDAVINKVLDHIDGVLYLDRDTLKFKLALNRADYDAETLIELRANIEVSRIDNYKKPQFLDLFNTVTVNYYNTANGGSGSLVQPNSALFLQQGMRKSVEADYTMCCNAGLAGRLLQRELDKQTNPYSSCDVYANSAAKTLRRGSVFKLTATDYNYSQTIMRVVDISYGDGKTKAIKISCVEDRFAMPGNSSVQIQNPDVPSTGQPVGLSSRLLIEEPYAFLVERLGQINVDNGLAESPDSGYYGIAAKREGNALTCEVFGDDGAGYENVARLDFCPYGELQTAVGPLDSSFTLENLSDIASLDDEILFQIDDEIMSLGSLDASTGAITGALRGCFDTIPAIHLEGAKVFFIGAWLDGAEKEYVSGETVNVKLVPTNSAGTLPLGSAPADTLTLVGRAAKPYAPGLFKIGGTAYPATVSGEFAVTWAHRDRKAQADQIVDTSQPSVSLPQNQRYGLRFSQANDDTLLVERLDIGAATATITLNYTGDVKCELWAIDDNGDSFQKHELTFGYTPPSGTPTNTITATAYTPYVPTWEIDGNGG